MTIAVESRGNGLLAILVILPDLWEGLLTRGFRSHMVHYPLVTDPGTRFHYSNASSDLLGMIVARACDVDHREFAKEHLFAPIGGIQPEAAATRRCWWSSWDSPLCP